MSWLHRLYETYEQCADKNQFSKDPLLPIRHTTQKADLEVTIDAEGNFQRANVIMKDDQTTIVPCTEESEGRTGSRPVNHPLCDKLQYVAGDFQKFGGEVTSGFSNNPHEPYRKYVDTLTNWCKSDYSHPKLAAILEYVKKGRIIDDLVQEKILFLDSQKTLLKEWTGDEQTTPPIFKKTKDRDKGPHEAFIRWRVEVPGNLQSKTWNDQEVRKSWIEYNETQHTKQGMCMVTGKKRELAKQHPANLRHDGDKAKLISSNDTSGYTFRGRFEDADQACTVSFDVTQKAHKSLKWLIKHQGFKNGSQVIVAWAVSGEDIPDPIANSATLFKSETREVETCAQSQGDAGQTFALRLNKYIAGYRVTLGSTNNIVVMALDSATPGRMAILYYRELNGSDFLDRVQGWHQVFSWHQNYPNKLRFFGAPSPNDIAEAAYGPSKDDTLKKLHKKTVERLLHCIIDGQAIPRDLMESTIRRTCNRSGFKHWQFEKFLGIACSLFKGSFKERNYQMALEHDRTTRDYLYGRLLAIAEHIEGRALYLADEKRDTNVAKLMQRFAERPYSTWRSIELALTPYKTRLRAKRPTFLMEMEKRLDEVSGKFQTQDFLDDQRLSGEFLLGYHCQREELWKGSKMETEEEEENNN